MTPIIWQYSTQDRAFGAPGYRGMTLYWVIQEWRNPPPWKRGTFAMRYYPAQRRTLAETLAYAPGHHERDLRGRL